MKDEIKSINGFSHLIQTLEGGALHADLCDDLHNVLTEMAGAVGGKVKRFDAARSPVSAVVGPEDRHAEIEGGRAWSRPCFRRSCR